MKTAYRVPDTPHASVKPGETGFKTVPISRMVPRSFFTNVTADTVVKPGAPVPVRGLAFGGIAASPRSSCQRMAARPGGRRISAATKAPYSFRRWQAQVTAPAPGTMTLMARCTNTSGVSQPAEPNWNANGFMRNVIETVRLAVVA
ncbi:MAG: hypothetical protein WDN49_20920 [Acetobacteraceae bacterium]